MVKSRRPVNRASVTQFWGLRLPLLSESVYNIVPNEPIVDVFYKVRQRIDAYADVQMNRSLLYKELHTVHRKQRDAEIRFDWENLQAQYVNFGKAKAPIDIHPGAFDPLSVFYYSRLFDPGRRALLERPVTDGKKCVIGRAAIVGRERIEVEGERYDTYLVEPELKEVGGVFEKSRDARIRIWVTADKRRIPVRIRSKVVIGSFTGDLVSVESIAPSACARTRGCTTTAADGST